MAHPVQFSLDLISGGSFGKLDINGLVDLLEALFTHDCGLFLVTTLFKGQADLFTKDILAAKIELLNELFLGCWNDSFAEVDGVLNGDLLAAEVFSLVAFRASGGDGDRVSSLRGFEVGVHVINEQADYLSLLAQLLAGRSRPGHAQTGEPLHHQR